MKTPEQIAAEFAAVGAYDDGSPIIDTVTDLVRLIAAAIEADRAQREPVHPDWQDDADMFEAIGRLEA